MECQSSDSKKLFKVFDARKRTRKKRDGLDDTNSVVTDDSTSGCQANAGRVPSVKASLQEISTAQTLSGKQAEGSTKRERERESSPSVTRTPPDVHRSSRSPRRHRRSTREGVSLALKAGLVSTPRSVTPRQEGEGVGESIPQDQDSFIYAFLEEAIKRDKKKQRHHRRREERRVSRDDEREPSPPPSPSPPPPRERHRHHHRHRNEVPSRDRDKPPKEVSPNVDQTILFETFAKMCAQINDKHSHSHNYQVPRTQSHKSLQCEVVTKRDSYDVERQPVRLRSHSKCRDIVASKIRSQENCAARIRSHEKMRVVSEVERAKPDNCKCYYEKEVIKYPSKLDMVRSRTRNVDDDRYRDFPPVTVPTRSCIDAYRTRPPPDHREYRDRDQDRDRDRDREYDREPRGRHYEDEKRRYCEQKTSRSFDVHREGYEDDSRRRTARSDSNKIKRYDYRDREKSPKYYDEKALDPRNRHNASSKDRRWRRHVERFERNSVASREDDYRDRDRDRDRFSERERDSGLSVADGETSTVSGRSNYLKVVKQEIAEQREAMDKMMKLWKELMRCFKGISQTQVQDKNIKSAAADSAANVRESAAAQLRLWRECMRRYETVARDVGDTDARLMEEIKKQRSEMAEMATMWQECLQRYRDMSNDFNNLKQQLVPPPESPTRLPAPPAPPLVCAEGEGTVPPAPYRLPHSYPPLLPGYHPGGSPLRGRASAPPAPPAWWWCGEQAPRDHEPRRRSSPDSRASKEREHRHRHKDRDESRYKEKSSKPSAARSEHRHRKR